MRWRRSRGGKRMNYYGNAIMYPTISPALLTVRNPFGGLKKGKLFGNKLQYYSGGSVSFNMATGYTAGIIESTGVDSGASSHYFMQVDFDSPKQNPMCMLLVPHYSIPYFQEGWGDNKYNTAQNDGLFDHVWYEPCLLSYNQKGGYDVRAIFNAVNYADDKEGTTKTLRYGYKNVFKSVDGATSVQKIRLGGVGTVFSSGNLRSFINNRSLTLKVNNNDMHICPETVYVSMVNQYNDLALKYDDFVTLFNTVSVVNSSNLQVYTDWCVASQIAASMPIFSWDDLESVYLYFKGQDPDYINKDDIKLSKVDFATDWTIYVNGERKPDIAVTMESPDIDAFLASADNTGGYKKSDFKIQYRYPTFKISNWGTKFTFEDKGIVNDITDIYDNTRSTSWTALTDLNYINKHEQLGDILDSPTAYALYAQLQFRLYLDDTMFSSWCEFGVGYIGSPSVSDFSLMDNWGNEISISDGSTVTIIYDQTPPDEDEYEKPDDEQEDTPPSDLDLSSALTTTYKITQSSLQLLGKYLWGATFIDDIKLINNSPIENIVSCKRLPFDIPAGVSRSLVLGNVTAPVNGNVISSVPIIDIGTITYHGYYGNFLDYSPYTRLLLFIPFCGFVEIDASVVTGKTINVKYALDIVLGKCKAMVYINGSYYMSMDGDMGIDIPLVASNRAQAEASFAVQGLDAALQGDVMGALGAAVATKYHTSRNGSYTPMCAWQETRKCFIIADIPTVQYPTSYGHDVGYPCMLTRTLATLSGFTVCSSDVDLRGFSCTDREIDMIKEILTTGIYL